MKKRYQRAIIFHGPDIANRMSANQKPVKIFMELYTVSFTYRQENYDALVRIKIKNEGNEDYHITIMNGELEKLLYGNHVLTAKNGKFDIQDTSLPIEIAELRAAIASALKNDINQPAPSA